MVDYEVEILDVHGNSTGAGRCAVPLTRHPPLRPWPSPAAHARRPASRHRGGRLPAAQVAPASLSPHPIAHRSSLRAHGSLVITSTELRLEPFDSAAGGATVWEICLCAPMTPRAPRRRSPDPHHSMRKFGHERRCPPPPCPRRLHLASSCPQGHSHSMRGGGAAGARGCTRSVRTRRRRCAFACGPCPAWRRGTDGTTPAIASSTTTRRSWIVRQRSRHRRRRRRRQRRRGRWRIPTWT